MLVAFAVWYAGSLVWCYARRVRKPRVKARKLVVPIALTFAISTTAISAATAIAVATSAGCRDEDPAPPVDAGLPDTPIV